MKMKVLRRGTGAYLILALDLVLLVIVLGVVMQTLTSRAIGKLAPVIQDQQRHWSELAMEPCVANQSPPAVPALAPGASAWDHIEVLLELRRIGPQIWSLYKGCREPRTEVINEELLHFRVNKFDEFETDPEPAYAKIRDFVDQNLAVRNQIYITGFTDDTFTDQYNFELSYRRALHVMNIIRQHLDAKGLTPGTSYRIYPLGMGRSQLLSRNHGENIDSWRRRCRRIELSFRSSGSVQIGKAQ
jgi:outer membrane protein OmpA-like peptidoglycan-associated protein